MGRKFGHVATQIQGPEAFEGHLAVVDTRPLWRHLLCCGVGLFCAFVFRVSSLVPGSGFWGWFWVQGFGFGFGFRISGLVSGSGFRVQGFGFRVSGLVSGSGFWVQGFGFRVSGSGVRVQGHRFRVSGFEVRD